MNSLVAKSLLKVGHLGGLGALTVPLQLFREKQLPVSS